MYSNISEILDAIVRRKDSAETELLKEMARVYPSNKKQLELKGMINAYKEAIAVIATSDCLKEEKLKK